MAEEKAVSGSLPQFVTQNLFVKSSPAQEEFTTKVEGYQFSKPDKSGSKVDYHALLQSFKTCGFQATNVALAIDQINLMVGACCAACLLLCVHICISGTISVVVLVPHLLRGCGMRVQVLPRARGRGCL